MDSGGLIIGNNTTIFINTSRDKKFYIFILFFGTEGQSPRTAIAFGKISYQRKAWLTTLKMTEGLATRKQNFMTK